MWRSGERGQSELIGVFLLISIMILVISSVGLGILGSITQERDPTIDAEISATATTMNVTHAGGDTISSQELMLIIRNQNGSNEIRFELKTIDFTGGSDGLFGPGDTFTRNHEMNSDVIEIILVHHSSESTPINEVVAVSPPSPGDSSGENQAPTANFSTSPDPLVAGDTGTFNASGSSDPDGILTAYEWDFTSDGSWDATGEIVSHTFGDDGTNTVSLRVMDDNGMTTTTTAVVTVEHAPTPMFQYSPSNPDPGETITFNASNSSDPNGTIKTYEWDWTSNNTYESTGRTATHSYSSEGNYTVTLRVTDNAGVTNTTTSIIQITSEEGQDQGQGQNQGQGQGQGQNQGQGQG